MKAGKNLVKMGTKIGAAVGAVLFLIFGIIPAFFFGGYGSLLVISRLTGGPVDPTLLVRAAMAVGILLGIICVASVCIAGGAILGTGIGYLLEGASASKEMKKSASAETK